MFLILKKLYHFLKRRSFWRAIFQSTITLNTDFHRNSDYWLWISKLHIFGGCGPYVSSVTGRGLVDMNRWNCGLVFITMYKPSSRISQSGVHVRVLWRLSSLQRFVECRRYFYWCQFQKGTIHEETIMFIEVVHLASIHKLKFWFSDTS